MSDTITKDIWDCEVSPPDGEKMCGPWGEVSRGDGPGLEPWFSVGLISMDLALAHTSSVTSGKCLNLSRPHGSHLKMPPSWGCCED